MLRPSSSRECGRLELFIACKGLSGIRDNYPNSFAVLSYRRVDRSKFKEIGRTETIFNSTCPHYCTSFEVDYSKESMDLALLRIEFYERQTEESERLHDHQLLGNATVAVEDILLAENTHYMAQMSRPVEFKQMGIVVLYAEDVDTTNAENDSEIQLDVSATVIRKRDWSKCVLGQRYELNRAHKHNNSDGQTVWLPICKSDRISKQRDSYDIVDFSSMALKYRHVCNGDDRRPMKISVYAAQNGGTGKKGGGEFFVGMVEFTLRDICEIDPTREVLPLEGGESGVEDLGVMTILKAEPTDFGSLFSVRLNYESTDKYTSAVCANESKLLMRRSRLACRQLLLGFREMSGNYKSSAGLDGLGSTTKVLFESSLEE